jgi:hypothetical protein
MSMKIKTLLYLLLVVLVTNGSSCVNDGFLIAVDFPIQSTFNINAGPSTAFGGTVTVKVTDQLGSAYRDNIKNVRYFDIRVAVSGAYTGSMSGSCFVKNSLGNNVKFLDFSGLWSDFTTPQTILGGSTHVTPQTAGTTELMNILNSLSYNPQASAVLSASGNVSQGPVPAGLSVTVTIYAQADSQVK